MRRMSLYMVCGGEERGAGATWRRRILMGKTPSLTLFVHQAVPKAHTLAPTPILGRSGIVPARKLGRKSTRRRRTTADNKNHISCNMSGMTVAA